jgi:small nuclear ribonucleoprotein (snRNP)-like protein
MAAKGQPMLVELKNGETYNGHLEVCDTWMNLSLKEVICTSPVSFGTFEIGIHNYLKGWRSVLAYARVLYSWKYY